MMKINSSVQVFIYDCLIETLHSVQYYPFLLAKLLGIHQWNGNSTPCLGCHPIVKSHDTDEGQESIWKAKYCTEYKVQ